MQLIQKARAGFGLIVEMNYDRLLFVSALSGALFLGAYFGS